MPEREREELFHEGQREKATREKEERKQEKKRRTAAFWELLERTPGIKVGALAHMPCGGCWAQAWQQGGCTHRYAPGIEV